MTTEQFDKIHGLLSGVVVGDMVIMSLVFILIVVLVNKL